VAARSEKVEETGSDFVRGHDSWLSVLGYELRLPEIEFPLQPLFQNS
jgi:hypothetical protein